mgnify:CR=1 FL=1
MTWWPRESPEGDAAGQNAVPWTGENVSVDDPKNQPLGLQWQLSRRETAQRSEAARGRH